DVGTRYRIPYPVLGAPGDVPGSPDNRSDHASFWSQGYLALHGGSLPGDEYHTRTDTAEKVDYPFVAGATRVVVARIAEAAGFLGVTPPKTGGGGGCAAGGAGASSSTLLPVLIYLAVLRRRS